MMANPATTVARWLALRTSRERLLLAVAAAAAALWLALAAVVQPLIDERARLVDRIARHDRALAVLAAPTLAAAPVVTDDRAVPVIVTESAATFQLAIRRLETEGAGVRLVLDDSPFDRIVLWLEALERDHGLRLTDLEMQRRPAPGVVGASLAFER